MLEHDAAGWLVRYGPPVLFFAQAFGIFGVPFPDELLLAVAGALIRKGALDAVPTASAAVVGCLTGITLSYLVGRTVEMAVVGPRLHIQREFLKRGQEWFRRYGGWLLMFGYFVPGVRHVTAIAAGSASLGYLPFAAYAYVGGILWTGVFLALGFYAGDRWQEVADRLHGHLLLALVIAACVLVAYVVLHARSQRSHS